MTNEKAPHRARRLSDGKLAPVTGGYGGSKKWDAGCERDARADYAANGAGMTFDEFLRKKVGASQIACRGTWVRRGCREDEYVADICGCCIDFPNDR